MRSLHIRTVVNNRVLSTEVIQYTFLLHDVIAIWDKHILSLHSAVNYSLQLHAILPISVHCCLHKTISQIVPLVVPIQLNFATVIVECVKEACTQH